MSFLDDIPGVKDIRDAVAGLVPRRNVLNVIGATVTDDPGAGETVVSAPTVNRWDTVNSSAGAENIANADVEVYKVAPASAIDIYGLGPPSPTGRALVLIVAEGYAVTLKHGSGSATAPAWRFECPSSFDVTVQPDTPRFLLYDRLIARWRPLL